MDREEDARPKKRGRKAKDSGFQSVDQIAGHMPEPETQPVKRKRGRPSLNKDAQVKPPQELEKTTKPAPRRRGRPSLSKQDMTEPDEIGGTEVAEKPALPQKRGRRPRISDAPEELSLHEPTGESDQPTKRKRGRPSLNNSKNAPVPPAESKNAEQPTRRKRREPSLQELSVSQEQNESREIIPDGEKRRRRGRPSMSDRQADEVENVEPKRRRGRPSGGGGDGDGDGEASKQAKEMKSKGRPSLSDGKAAIQSKGPRRRPSGQRTSSKKYVEAERTPYIDEGVDEADTELRTQRPKQPKYRHLAPRVRHIPRSTIEAKWAPLEPSSISAVAEILRLAERPVIQRLSSKRREHASSAIRIVAKRLTHKLSRGLPFPPASAGAPQGKGKRKNNGDNGREAEINFETVLNTVQTLERQLDPLLHAIELLNIEKEKTEKELEGDYEELRVLEVNARATARDRKEKLRKIHTLVPGPKESKSHKLEKEALNIVRMWPSNSAPLFKVSFFSVFLACL
jgi:hypothetical protein